MSRKASTKTFLDRTICPGCGTENPPSKHPDYFACQKCEWESDAGLPTIGGIINANFHNCANVDLSRYLKTLLHE